MKNSRSLKIDLRVVVFSLVLFTLFRFCSPIFINGTNLASVYTLLSKAITVVVVSWYVFRFRKASAPFLLVLLFFSIRLYITGWYVPENIMRVFMGAYPILALICISEIFLKTQRGLYINSFAFCLKLLCTVNALQSIFLPSLFYQKYIIGGENQIVFSYILSVVLEKACEDNNSRSSKWYLALLTVSIVRIFSAGNVLGWGVFLFLFFYYRKPRKIKGLTVFGGYCISWLLVVVVRVQNAFAWLIVDILHKNLTLTNRTVIWDKVFALIKERPLFGYGVQNTVNLFYIFIRRVGRPNVDSWFSAHNQVVQTLYESGIISMIPIILFAVISIKKLDQHRNDKMYAVMIAGIIGISISLMAEAPGWDSLFILLTLSYHIHWVSGEKDCKNSSREKING